jgi:radical SAM superfamily enzyme YgiQ (UPF0313 family)
MPLAPIALMNLLTKNGFEVEGLNYGLEMSLDNRFDFVGWLRNRDFKAVAIDLHYHGHSYDALRLAETCKAINPNATIILGGLTATYFSTEILRDFRQIDIVIKGDAEEPLLSVIKNGGIHKIQNLGDIDNVSYRNGNVIKDNPIGYAATQSDLDSLDFVDVKCLRHWRQYYKILPWGYQPNMGESYWTCVGRGCRYSCSYCGGSRMSHHMLCNRSSPVFRSPLRLADDVSYLQENGVKTVMVSHDLHLTGKKYWRAFFAEVRKRRIDVGIYMGLWQLFEKEFIDDLARTFDTSRSWLGFSPTSGNEFVRRFNGKHFSDNEFFERLRWLKSLGFQLDVFFASNLPKETRSTFDESIALGKKIRETYSPGKLRLHCQPIILDPCCPMSVYPQKFGIEPLTTTFTDYYTKNKEYYERLESIKGRSHGGELKYFSHTTETIKSPRDINLRRDKWRKQVFGIEREDRSS